MYVNNRLICHLKPKGCLVNFKCTFISMSTCVVKVVVAELVFYGPSPLLRSFQAWSVNLSLLFPGKPPRQFTST